MQCQSFAVLRHGHAENNEAEENHKAGNPRAYDEAIKWPSSCHDLTDEGKQQAIKTGVWLKAYGFSFSHFIVSGFLRAMRTASLLDIPGAHWEIEERLCEKDSGVLNTLTPSKVVQHIASRGNLRHEHDPYRFRPEHGESFLDLDVRIRSVFDSIPDKTLVVCHGHVIRVLDRIIMEGMSAWEFSLFNPVRGDIPNGAFIEYRCEDGVWMRRQNVPHAETPFVHDWTPIVFRRHTTLELGELVDRVLERVRS
jgi:broad specificity phosphatase PhoE